MAIKNLFSEKRKVMSQKSISDITGSATPVESSDYIDNYLIKKERFLPPINFETASNFAKFGSARQYSADAVQRIHNTYPYDGSLNEKITWLNSSNFYDLYIFNNKYPRTCGYAVFSPLGWGTATATLNGFGYSDSLEYIQLKGGPHPDPSSGSLKLSRQFPAPYNGRANLYDATTGVSRESNLALDLDEGVTVEYWIKGPSSAAVVTELGVKTATQVSFDLWNGYTGNTEGNSYGRFMLCNTAGALKSHWASGSQESEHTVDTGIATALSDGNWHHVAVTAKQVQDGSDFKIEWNDFLDGNWLSKELSSPLTAQAGAVTGSLIANIGAARIPALDRAAAAGSSVVTLVTNGTNEGYGKLSGSIDEFRYWKTARTPQQIKRFWNTQIGGGSNTDNMKFSGSAQPVDLGVYYKFNEGNVGNATTDASVLDYSGRISNGVWTGYMTGSSRIAGETSSAMIESSASVSEFKDPIIYSFHPDVSALSSLLVAEGEEWDLQNNMALYHTMPEWITSEDQDKGGEQLKKLTQIIASQLDMIYLQIGALPTLGDKKYPFEEIVTHDPDSPHEANTKTFDYKNSPSPFARNALEDTGMISQEIFSMANDLATLGNRDEREEFEQKLYDIKNTIYQNIYNNITYIYKSKGTEKSFRNLIRCYGVDDELIKINLYVDNTTYTYADSNYRSTSVKNKYIDFNETDRIQSTIYQSASVSTPNSISYIPGYNPANAATAGATGSAMTFEADIIFPHKFKNDHVSNLWYDYPYLTSSIFGCHEAESRVISPATCTFGGYAALLNENNTTLTLTQADGTNVVFTTDSSVTKVGSGNLTIGTQLIGSDADATESLWTALNVTINLGNLDMTLSPSVYGGETEITLTQNTGGYAGNTLVVNPVGILAQKSLSSATPRFTGGVGINSDDFSSQYTGLPASITVEGKASLNAQNGTTLTLVNADGTSVNFATNSGIAYTVPPFTLIVAPAINTAGITSDNHATIALHHAFTQAIGQGTLKMSIVPATITSHTSFQLIQNLPGSSGNTAVTVPTGVSVNSAGDGTNTSFTGGVADQASFQVYALRDVEESQDVRFMLTSSNGNIPTLTSPLFQEVYDNERWMFAVKAYPQSPLEGLHVSGSGTNSVSGSWIVELQGYNPLLDQMQNSFVVSASIPAQDGTYFMNANKRLYAGAHRVNFSGSVDKYTDIKVGSIRVWDDYLSDFELAAHAKDPTNFGRERTYKNSYLFSLDTPPESDITSIPQFETLLLNWTFEDVTGSTAGAYLKDHYGGSDWNGSFEVLDYSSGSDDKWEVDARYKYHYTGRGDWFLPADTTSLVDLNFLSAVKTNLPEVSSGEDTINILTTDDNFFTRDSRPINHYFSFEKNMYQNISEEMLRLFATTVEFNNLVGEPVNRYRQEYKSLGKLREAFFRKVGNVPDFNKFVEFYKWIDGSLGDMITQLTPMSANISDGIKTVIESHILERNKYWNKFPTLEIKDKPIVGRLKGVNELSYDWEHGHAPLNPTQNVNEGTNCLWWKERAESSGSASGDIIVDTDRNVLRRILTSDVTTNKIIATGEYTDPTDYPNSGFPNAAEFNLAQDGANLAARTQYKGSTYALRSFSKPYKMEAEETVQIHGGINSPDNQRRDVTKLSAQQMAQNVNYRNYISTFPAFIDDLKDCDDVLDPNEKKHHAFAMYPFGTTGTAAARANVPFVKGTHFAPFNLVSSSVTTNASLAETGIDIVNLHTDGYGNNSEIPMQGPFTERHVGGMAYRHHDISDGTHTSANRAELFRVGLAKDFMLWLTSGNRSLTGYHEEAYAFDQFYRDGVAKRPVNIRNILTTTDSALSQSALGNYESEIQILNTHNEGGTFLAKMQAATGSDGFYTINSPNISLVLSDTADTPKLLAVGKTLLDSSTDLLPPYSTSQFSPYLSKNKITERFSAPGDPSTAGDAFGGFGIDKASNKYSVYNALPWRNRQVRVPVNALLAAHTGKYGSFSGSTLSATDATTAATASFHKSHRNTDYVVKYVDDKIGDAGTTYCAQRFDNYYIQHPIPANDFGYAWITASADHSEGCELLTTASFITASDFGSYNLGGTTKYGAGGAEAAIKVAAGAAMIYDNFVGLNYNLLDPVSAETNTLGFQPAAYYTSIVDYAYKGPGVDLADSAGGVYFHILNGLLLHRNGPYGYPSWKQIRGGNHPIVREHKKHNILSSVADLEIPDAFNPNKRARARILTNVKETPVTLDYPMVHKVETVSNGVLQPLTLQHTYANNLVLFTHPTIAGKLAKPLSEKPRQMYDEIKDQYLAGMYDAMGNLLPPLKAFKTLIYKQTLYPKTENMYLSGSRGRLAYAETAAYISQSKNGEYRTFWKDNLADRRREDGALNSLGYPIHASFNQAGAPGADQVSKLVIGEGTLSIWPLDVGVGNSDHASSVADDKFYIKGLYTLKDTPAVVPSADEYGGTWGELHRDTIGTLFGSLTTAQLRDLNGLNTRGDASTFHHFMGDHHFITHPTASQCFNHYQLSGMARGSGFTSDLYTSYPIVGGIVSDTYYLGAGLRGPTPANWKTHTWSGRAPWYDSYEDYSSDIRSMGQEYTVIPEFKISDHMDYYIQQGNFEEQNFKFLSLPGGSVTSSADTEKADYDQTFWKEYTHSDFMEHFEMVQADHSEYANMSVIELKCSAVKKLLPYDGFYPVQRCLQLGALMSSSYAPFLWGSSETTYGPTSDTNENLKYEAERLQSFLQPFYAPGIMYNTVKSGIAVDYPIHTSQAEVQFATISSVSSVSGSLPLGQVNSASGSYHVVMSDPDYRMPFEALVNPDAFLPTTDPESFTFGSADLNLKKMYLTAPYYGSSSFYAQWQGTSKPNYRLAINNFCAEVPNFFLKNKTLTTFRSKRQSEFNEFKSGSTYYMDVILQKTPDMVMNHHFGATSATVIGGGTHQDSTATAWGFGPSYHVTGTASGFGMLGTPSSAEFSNFGDPTYAVHAPPYYYGRAVARLAFAPHEATEMEEGQTSKFSLFNILENVKVCPETQYFKEVGVGQLDLHTASYGNLVRNLEDSLKYPAKEHQMHISSSVNLFGSTFLPDIDFDADTKRPIAGKLLKNPANSAWVMNSKWETPVLNFANGTGGGLGPGETAADLIADLTGSWWNAPQYPKALQRPLGMWNGYGSHPTGETGLTLSLKESYPDKIQAINTTLTGSLIDNCGFQAQQRKIGELANHKWISEAVVAIPFVDVAGERKFFSLGETRAQSKQIFNQALAGEDGPGRSVKQMAERMPRFVFPPHMDFVNNSAVEPFVMYIFEFSHKLTQKDLSNIWQNVMPDIGVTARKTTSSLQHLVGKNEFFRGEKLPHNTRWMVFKVKQRSAANYFKMTQDSKDDHNFKFDFEGGASVENYNYNWPYDFFSLVELAKIDSRIGIGDEAFKIKPLTSPKFGSNIVNQAVPDPPGPTNTAMDDFTYGQLLSDQKFEVDTGVENSVQNSKIIAANQLGKSGADSSMMKMMKKLSGGKATQQNFPTNDPTF